MLSNPAHIPTDLNNPDARTNVYMKKKKKDGARNRKIMMIIVQDDLGGGLSSGIAYHPAAAVAAC